MPPTTLGLPYNFNKRIRFGLLGQYLLCINEVLLLKKLNTMIINYDQSHYGVRKLKTYLLESLLLSSPFT